MRVCTPIVAVQEHKRAISERYRKDIAQKVRVMSNILKKGFLQFRSRSSPIRTTAHRTHATNPGMQPISTLDCNQGPGVPLQLASVPKQVEDDLRVIARHWHAHALQNQKTSVCPSICVLRQPFALVESIHSLVALSVVCISPGATLPLATRKVVSHHRWRHL